MHEIRRTLALAARHLSQPVASVLSLGDRPSALWQPQRSSATFTTYGALECDAHYWKSELPLESDLGELCVRDAAWASLGPICYEDVAHILIPRYFAQELYKSGKRGEGPRYVDTWTHEQDIDGLSRLLSEADIAHYLARQVLEIKRF